MVYSFPIQLQDTKLYWYWIAYLVNTFPSMHSSSLSSEGFRNFFSKASATFNSSMDGICQCILSDFMSESFPQSYRIQENHSMRIRNHNAWSICLFLTLSLSLSLLLLYQLFIHETSSAILMFKSLNMKHLLYYILINLHKF